MTAPLEADPVAGTVPVTGTVSDDTGVESVELLVDGESVASKVASEAGEVAFDWNSLTVTNGTHTLRLRAHDAAGNTGLSDGVSVTTENFDEEPPTPPSGLTGTWSKPSQVSLAWSAASDNGAVNGYRVYRDGDPMIDLGPAAGAYVDEGVANLTTHTYLSPLWTSPATRATPVPRRGGHRRRHAADQSQRPGDSHGAGRGDRVLGRVDRQRRRRRSPGLQRRHLCSPT